jgi:peptidoglycan biosynthesis protein MviN/MurJ (putative lipid II flippase)
VSPGIDRRVPIGGSIVQSVIAAAVILVAIILNADPLPPSSPAAEAAAIGVLFMIGASLSVILFYRRTPARPERWQWLIAPAVGGVALTVILAITVLNITQVTGSTTSYVQWLLPGVILVAAITGAVWAQVLRQRRPGVYAAIGYGLPKPLAVLDRSLSHLEL